MASATHDWIKKCVQEFIVHAEVFVQWKVDVKRYIGLVFKGAHYKEVSLYFYNFLGLKGN